jgi:ribosome biogenesis protein ENP2
MTLSSTPVLIIIGGTCLKPAVNCFQGGSENEESPSDSDSSSDDDRQWTKEVKRQHHLLRQEKMERRKAEENEEAGLPRFFELKEGEEFKGLQGITKKKQNK